MTGKCPDPMLLSAYLDGELIGKKWLKIAGHLEKCAHCQRELRELERVKAMVASLPLRPAPRIRSELFTSPPKVATKKWVWAACLAFAMALLGFSLNTIKPEPGEVTGEYLRIHRQYEQQIAQNSQRIGELLEESQ